MPPHQITIQRNDSSQHSKTTEMENERQIEDFKIKMAEWIYDLSICFSSDAKPLDEKTIVTMVEMIVRLVVANGMTFELKPYSNAVRDIGAGKVEIYKLTVVNLMKVFTEKTCEYFAAMNSNPLKW